MSTPYQFLTTEVRARKAAEHLTAGAFGRLASEDLTPERYRETAELLESAAAQCRRAGSAKAMAEKALCCTVVVITGPAEPNGLGQILGVRG